MVYTRALPIERKCITKKLMWSGSALNRTSSAPVRILFLQVSAPSVLCFHNVSPEREMTGIQRELSEGDMRRSCSAKGVRDFVGCVEFGLPPAPDEETVSGFRRVIKSTKRPCLANRGAAGRGRAHW